MKQKFILTLTFFFACILYVNAQVTIGSNNDPHKGALLDLKSETKGLLLPRVSLSDVNIFGLDADETGPNAVSEATGMMIYNTNADIVGGNGKGIYVWSGETWRLIGTSFVNSIAITGATELYSDRSSIYTANILPLTASNKNVLWSIISDGEDIARIDPSTGKLTPIKFGIVTIVATALDGSCITGSLEVKIAPAMIRNMFEIPNGTYEQTSFGYLTELEDGDSFSAIETYFRATNKTLYLDKSDITSPTSSNIVSWDEAISTCENNQKRLLTLYELAQLQLIYHSYNFRPQIYWTGTERNESEAWDWDFSFYCTYFGEKAVNLNARCAWSE